MPELRPILASPRAALLLASLCCLAAGCATTGAPAGEGGGRTGGAAGGSPAAEPASASAADSDTLIPAGYGTLRQEDIAIRLSLRGIQMRAIPMQESIIRVLSPDSYRALSDLLESRRAQTTMLAARRGARQPSVWYVSFFGVEPDARFSPMELVITSGGRDHRPLEIVPLTPGFGENRLRQRETQSALYVFEDGVDPEQPLTVSMQGERSTVWQETLRRIERERALIRSRAAARPPRDTDGDDRRVQRDRSQDATRS